MEKWRYLLCITVDLNFVHCAVGSYVNVNLHAEMHFSSKYPASVEVQLNCVSALSHSEAHICSLYFHRSLLFSLESTAPSFLSFSSFLSPPFFKHHLEKRSWFTLCLKKDSLCFLFYFQFLLMMAKYQSICTLIRTPLQQKDWTVPNTLPLYL